MFDPLGFGEKKGKQAERPKSSKPNEPSKLSNLPPPPTSKPKVEVKTFDDGWGENDWNFDDIENKQDDIDISSKDYQHKNLNKLSDAELAREKKKMDKKFEQNFVKPNDPSFVYDKVVDFSKQ